MAKIMIGDKVCPKGARLFKDTYRTVKTVKDVGIFHGREIIRFEEYNGKHDYVLAKHFTNDAEIIKARDKALANTKFVYAKEEDQYDGDPHISSKSGKPKVGHEDVYEALEATWSMALRLGGEWVYYQCPECGLYHTGKNEEINN